MIKKLLKQYKNLFIEGSWVLFGQISVTIINLIGLRIFTEIAPTNILGEATLLLGVLFLFRNIFIAPIQNTQIRFYPQYKNKGQAKWFDENIKKLNIMFMFISILIFTLFYFVWSYLSSNNFNFLLLLILIFYFVVNVIKGYKINTLIAERRQKYVALWQITDTMLINVLFICALLLVNNVESYLTGQTIGLFIGLFFYGYIFYPQIENIIYENTDYSEIKKKFFTMVYRLFHLLFFPGFQI